MLSCSDKDWEVFGAVALFAIGLVLLVALVAHVFKKEE